MNNLPFDKWTLKFHSEEFERQYERHENKIRLLCFRIILFFVCIAGLACLMVFTVQQKPTYMVMMVVGIIVLSFLIVLFCHKMEAYMKQVFSIILIIGTLIYIFIEFIGIEMYQIFISSPHGVLGYSVGCSTMGLIQYSDNRVKLVFVLSGINVLLGVLEVFQLATLHFVIYAYTSMIFVGSLAYMNEYTSRLSFSLNLKLEKQRELIYEFFQDAILAVSLNERTNQFVLEFKNKKVEDLLGIQDTEKMKAFLRSSFFTKQYILSTKLHGEHQKLLTLEDFLFEKIKLKEEGQTRTLPDISYIMRDQKNQQIEIHIQVQLKLIDYGKPHLILIIKQKESSNLIDECEKKIKEYQVSIVQWFNSIATEQIKIYSQIKKLQILMQEEEMIKRILCMNLSLINKTRNHIIYFQKDKIRNHGQIFTTFSLSKYLSIISQYCHSLSAHFNRRFKLINQSSQNMKLSLNSQFLTQIIVNLFEWVLKQSLKYEVITLQIREEASLNPRRRPFVSLLKRNEFSDQNQRLLCFIFCFYNDLKIDFDDWRMLGFDHQQFNISKDVTNYLLTLLGPYNVSYFNQIMNPEQGAQFSNYVQFYIYTNQSQLEPSFVNAFHNQNQSSE